MSTQAAAEQIEAHMSAYWQHSDKRGDPLLSVIEKAVSIHFKGCERDGLNRLHVVRFLQTHYPLLPVDKMTISILYDSDDVYNLDAVVSAIVLGWK